MTRALLRLAFGIALAVCTYLALTPSPPQAVSGIDDVLLHGFAFIVLTMLCAQAYFPSALLMNAIVMLLYGAGLELAQGQIAARSAEWSDLFVDLVGIALGTALHRACGAWLRQLLSDILQRLGLEGRDV